MIRSRPPLDESLGINLLDSDSSVEHRASDNKKETIDSGNCARIASTYHAHRFLVPPTRLLTRNRAAVRRFTN